MANICYICGCTELPLYDNRIICKECGTEIVLNHIDETDTTFNVTDPMFPISSKTIYISQKSGNMDVYRSNLYDSKVSKEKSKKHIFEIIQYTLNNSGNYCDEIIMSKILYDKYISSPLYKPSRRGKIIKNVAGIVLLAFKTNKKNITYKDIAEMFKISPSDVGEGEKNVRKVLDNVENPCEDICFISSKHDMIEKYGDILELDNDKKEFAKNISNLAEEKGLFSKCTPSSSAIGTLYYTILIYGLNISEVDIIKKTHISSVTVNKIRRSLTNTFGLSI